jgi:hypothetical protein
MCRAPPRRDGACREANVAQSAFVEATIQRRHARFAWNGVNGLPGSTFGQFACCYAGARHCGERHHPRRSAGDNVTTYLAGADGRYSTFSSTHGVYPVHGPDLTDNRTPTTSLALNELQAAAHRAPAALIPPADPMTQVNVEKTNLDRAGVKLPAIDPKTETRLLPGSAHDRTQAPHTDRRLLQTAPSRESGNGIALLAFLIQRPWPPRARRRGRASPPRRG